MKLFTKQRKRIFIVSVLSLVILVLSMVLADMRIGKMLDLDPHTFLLYAHADSERKIGQITLMGKTYPAPYPVAKSAAEFFEKISNATPAAN